MSWIACALEGSLYSVTDRAAAGMVAALEGVHQRVDLLRAHGTLTPETLRRYYGAKRFEQVAESNAIEGSTLSVGETELAIVKGVTLTGHDPGFVRDAVALNNALTRLTEMAREDSPTDLAQIKELHGLVLEGRVAAGSFRTNPVRISGSEHRPPKTWRDVMSAMEELEAWSLTNATTSPVLRAAVLHAWLAHIHPFSDGNGRTSRAVANLDLVRAGYPPIIIRKVQDRDRYLAALQTSDFGGDLGAFLDLVLDRTDAALTGLEAAAKEKQGYSTAIQMVRRAQARRLEVWNTSVELLYKILVDQLATMLDAVGGSLDARLFQNPLDLDDFIALSSGRPISRSWAFKFRASAPGVRTVERLAWFGFRSTGLRAAVGTDGEFAPSLFWSSPNPDGYPPWILSSADAPGLCELSVTPGAGDEWHVLSASGAYASLGTTEAAKRIAKGVFALMAA
jgi:Fic family protein